MPVISTSSRHFAEVANGGSIGRATARLNTSPSAVNRGIRNFEAELKAGDDGRRMAREGIEPSS